MEVQPSTGNTDSPAGAAPAKLARSNNYSTAGADNEYGSQHGHRRNRRGSQPMAIRVIPYTGLLFCIAAEGIFRLGPGVAPPDGWLRLVVRFPSLSGQLAARPTVSKPRSGRNPCGAFFN